MRNDCLAPPSEEVTGADARQNAAMGSSFRLLSVNVGAAPRQSRSAAHQRLAKEHPAGSADGGRGPAGRLSHYEKVMGTVGPKDTEDNRPEMPYWPQG